MKEEIIYFLKGLSFTEVPHDVAESAAIEIEKWAMNNKTAGSQSPLISKPTVAIVAGITEQGNLRILVSETSAELAGMNVIQPTAEIKYIEIPLNT